MEHTNFLRIRFGCLMVGALIAATPLIYRLRWENDPKCIVVVIGIFLVSIGLSIQK